MKLINAMGSDIFGIEGENFDPRPMFYTLGHQIDCVFDMLEMPDGNKIGYVLAVFPLDPTSPLTVQWLTNTQRPLAAERLIELAEKFMAQHKAATKAARKPINAVGHA